MGAFLVLLMFFSYVYDCAVVLAVYYIKTMNKMCNEIKISDHALTRGKERLGWSKKVVIKMGQKAFDLGMCRHKTSGRLGRYLQGVYDTEKLNPIIKIYGEFIYIFVANNTTDWKLVTLWKLPNKYIPLLNNFLPKPKKHKASKPKKENNFLEDSLLSE